MKYFDIDPGMCPGNNDKYYVKHIKLVNSPLKGKKIIFLGSSVTLGACSFHQSFVDDLAAKDGIKAIKEAVNGTTLAVRDDGQSYVERLKNLSPQVKADAFVCQLSTNDARKGAKLGRVSDSFENFDVHTTIGAMEYIIAYVRKTYRCPIIFYTGTKFDNESYESMIAALHQLKDKWQINVLDLWHDQEMNSVSQKDYHLYMHDPIHPTKAGYLLWWLPKFEQCLLTTLCK